MELWMDTENFITQVENKLMKVNGKETLSMEMEKSIMKNLVTTKDNLTIKTLMN